MEFYLIEHYPPSYLQQGSIGFSFLTGFENYIQLSDRLRLKTFLLTPPTSKRSTLVCRIVWGRGLKISEMGGGGIFSIKKRTYHCLTAIIFNHIILRSKKVDSPNSHFPTFTLTDFSQGKKDRIFEI